MIKLIFLLFIPICISCTKQSVSDSINKRDSIQSPAVQIKSKDYQQTSYELQKTSVNEDLMALRTKSGVSSYTFVLACTFLDINGDGNDDIFMSYGLSGINDRVSSKIYLFKGGSYILDSSYFTILPSFYAARKAITGDFNKDGIPDIFVAGHGIDLPPFPGEYTQLLLSNTNKKYDLVKFIDKIGFYHGTCSGDIDNDGDLDIFILGASKSYFLINDGKGTFSYSTSQIDINTLEQEYTCELVDIDKDGFLDLIMGGHEFIVQDSTFSNINYITGSTRIYWGNPKYFFDTKNMTNIPIITNWGVITDLDIYDLDSDGKNEIIITRSGGRKGSFDYFYNGWRIQIVQINNRTAVDKTDLYMENYIYEPKTPNNQEWIPWMRFDNYDDNGRIDFISTKGSTLPFLRWELRNGKLIRIN